MSEKVELLTIYRGRDSATYLLSEWEKLGDDAEPLFVNQYPGDNKPFVKMDMKDVDALYKHTALTKEEIKADPGKWDKEALKKLLATQSHYK